MKITQINKVFWDLQVLNLGDKIVRRDLFVFFNMSKIRMMSPD